MICEKHGQGYCKDRERILRCDISADYLKCGRHYKKACAGNEELAPGHWLMSNSAAYKNSADDNGDGANVVSDDLYRGNHKPLALSFQTRLQFRFPSARYREAFTVDKNHIVLTPPGFLYCTHVHNIALVCSKE